MRVIASSRDCACAVSGNGRRCMDAGALGRPFRARGFALEPPVSLVLLRPSAA